MVISLDEIRGFGPVLIERVQKRWPKLLDDQRLRTNPYLMCGVRGIGFKLADVVGHRLGIRPDSPHRVTEGADYVLGQLENSGHTADFDWMFHRKLSDLLSFDTSGRYPIPETKVQRIAGLWSRQSTFHAERAVALKLESMISGGDADYDLAFTADGLKSDQLQALQAMKRARIYALTGSPGVGKTSTIRAIFSQYAQDDIALAAPTGKAAKRIEQVTGRPACTIHRLLEVVGELSDDYDQLPYAYSPGFKFRRRRGNPLDTKLIVIDEASMIDIRLMADLCSALRDDARLILVGDSFQLPSVGPGSVLRDLIRSGVVPQFELTELKRQDPNLLIAKNCRSIRYEKRVTVDNSNASDFYFIPVEDPEEISELVVDLVTRRLPSKFNVNPMCDVITLTARRKHGATSAEYLNRLLRRQLNPKGGGCFGPGDRVIQLHNDYDLDIMNGDIGTIAAVGEDHITVDFEVPPRTVTIPQKEADLMHAWALTVHKAQGSEWPWVVVPVHEEQGDFVVSAQHFYTAISRARDGCVVVGQRAWMEHIAANHRDDRRVTRLAKFLTDRRGLGA
jgi:exodeoxyribonuclease V alpha subunit